MSPGQVIFPNRKVGTSSFLYDLFIIISWFIFFIFFYLSIDVFYKLLIYLYVVNVSLSNVTNIFFNR